MFLIETMCLLKTSTVAPGYELSGYHFTEAVALFWLGIRLMISFWGLLTVTGGLQRPSKKHLLWSQPRVDRPLVIHLPKSYWQKTTWKCSELDTALIVEKWCLGIPRCFPRPSSPPPSPVMALWSHPLRQTEGRVGLMYVNLVSEPDSPREAALKKIYCPNQLPNFQMK